MRLLRTSPMTFRNLSTRSTTLVVSTQPWAISARNSSKIVIPGRRSNQQPDPRPPQGAHSKRRSALSTNYPCLNFEVHSIRENPRKSKGAVPAKSKPDSGSFLAAFGGLQELPRKQASKASCRHRKSTVPRQCAQEVQ